MTPLKRAIAETIRSEGPMRLDRYMALCLSHPSLGYYATRDPFGAGGDFVTAPEISQMFGELLGLWATEVWRLMGAPARFSLVELGPGRGTLMADMLRAGRAAPGFLEAAEVVLVETSPTLREVQARTLERAGVSIRWTASIEEALPSPLPSGERSRGEAEAGEGLVAFPANPVPPHPALRADLSPQGRGERTTPRTPDAFPGTEGSAPAIIVSNEFFDALPIRQFAATDRGWRERLVGLVDDRLAFGLAPDEPTDLTLPAAPEGAVHEVCADALDVTSRIARHIAAHGGACLAIDYGYGSGHGDTLQAVKAHAFADPLEAPGEADLTAHVDFAALAAAAGRQDAAVMRLLPQADLLERLGLSARAGQLAAKATPAQREAIAAAVARLTDRSPRGMGALFKALAISDPRLGPLPGFELAPRRGA